MDKIRNSLDLNLNSVEQRELMKHIPDTEELADRVLENSTSEQASPLVEKLYQSGQLNSDKYNQFFRDVFLDLYSLYQKSRKIKGSIDKNNELNSEIINRIRQQVENIKEKVDKYRTLLHNNKGFTRAYYDYFDDKDKFEAYEYDRNLFYNNKKGRIFNKENLATVDVGMGLISARSGIDTPNTMYPSIVKQTGSNLKPHPENNNIGNIFDTRENTNWKETILADEPFHVPINDVMYYGKEKGAFAKLRILIPTTENINYIDLKPYSDLPFEIISIYAYNTLGAMHLTNEEDKTLEDVKSDDDVNILLSPEDDSSHDNLLLDKSKKITFDEVKDCKALEIAIRQNNYKYTSYTNLLEERQKIDMMNDLFKDNSLDLDIRTTDYNNVTELDYSNRNKTWKRYDSIFKTLFEKIKNTDIGDLTDTIVNAISYILPGISKYQLNKLLNRKTADTQMNINKISTQKYLYEYGLKELDLGYQEIANESIYVSKPYELDTNVKEVAINVDEYIPKDTYENKLGHIEYFVTNSTNPSKDEWYEIIPEDKTRDINNEPIVIDENRKGNILFPAEIGTLNVYSDYKKNTSVNINEVTETINDNDMVTGFTISTTEDVKYSKYLYASYHIDDRYNPYIVDFNAVSSPSPFIGRDGKEGEIFDEGTDKDGHIQLTNFPYIDYDKVNDLNSTVKPDIIISNEDEQIPRKYIVNNEYINKYNPNYRYGYRPINVTMDGSYLLYNSEDEITETEEGVIENDTIGLNYLTSYYDETNNESININRFKNKIEYVPYFYNRTKYKQRENPALKEFDAKNYPVFEYIQDGKNIFFNDSLHKYGTENKGSIRIKYDYLVENLRVKIVMYNFTSKNITPVLRNYFLKSRSFQYIPGGFK